MNARRNGTPPPFRAPRDAARRRARGFTLVEVAVSLLVVAVGFTAVMAIFPVGMQLTQDAVYNNAGTSGGLAVAQAALAQDPRAGITGAQRLSRALLPGKAVDSEDDDDFSANVFENNGLYYVVRYRARNATSGTWGDWTLFTKDTDITSVVAAIDHKASSAAELRLPVTVKLRVFCFRTLPKVAVASASNGELQDDANFMGVVESVSTVTRLVPIPTS